MTCCILWVLEENAAIIIRPGALENISSKANPISFSDRVNPSCSTFVLSEKSASTPFLPYQANLCRSVTLPSMGVWSNLKSPEWITVPIGVFIASPTPSAMLCVTRRYSILNAPSFVMLPGLTLLNLVFLCRSNSFNFSLIRPKVSFVP